jgi:Fe-S-cluster containining protein
VKPNQDTITMMVDWGLPPDEFEAHVGQIIHRFMEAHKTISLPIELNGHNGHDLLISLLAKLDCSGCDAQCCKNPDGFGKLAIDPREYAHLQKKYPQICAKVHWVNENEIASPCPFLKDNRCQAYYDRPFMCWCYPFQIGWVGSSVDHAEAEAAGVSSACPAGRKLAKGIYLARYQLRRSMLLLQGEERRHRAKATQLSHIGLLIEQPEIVNRESTTK